jgi:hypothetical protein
MPQENNSFAPRWQEYVAALEFSVRARRLHCGHRQKSLADADSVDVGQAFDKTAATNRR